MWSTTLTAGEVSSLHGGAAPSSVQAAKLQLYYPLEQVGSYAGQAQPTIAFPPRIGSVPGALFPRTSNSGFRDLCRYYGCIEVNALA